MDKAIKEIHRVLKKEVTLSAVLMVAVICAK
ncbi:MAG: hypothetical protein ACLT2Z_07515 [Eubacterium sp.]